MNDHVMLADERERHLVCMIKPLPLDLPVQPGDPHPRSAVGPGTVLFLPSRELGELPLRLGKRVSGHFPVARIRDMRATAGREEVRDPHVDADDLAGGRERLGGYVVTGKDYEPALTLALGRDCFDPSGYWPVLVDTDVADAEQVDTGHRWVLDGVPATTVGTPHACRPSD